MPVDDKVEIVTLMQAYSRSPAKEAIQAAIKKPLNGLKVACYYGCLYARPPKITGAENCEDPQGIDEVVRLTGATVVDWSFKTECCGAGRHVDLPKEAKPLIYRILKNARANGAEAIVAACPLCMMNLDMRQHDINMVFGEDFNLPVYFFTELLAIAMGASYRKSGVTTHFHPAKKLLKKVLSKKEVV
jgi:heterodisulfide reductase subunit B